MGRALAVSLIASMAISKLTSGNVVTGPRGVGWTQRCIFPSAPSLQLEGRNQSLCLPSANLDQGGACVCKAPFWTLEIQ